MKRLLELVIFFTVFLVFLPLAEAQDVWTRNIFWGIDFLQRKTSEPNKIFVLKVDLKRQGIRAFVNPESFINKTVSQFVSTYGVQVGINTAFFDIGATGKAIGYFESQGGPYVNNIPNAGYTTAGITANNEFLYGKSEIWGPVHNAFSTYPVLVVNGRNVAPDHPRHPRTAIGIDASGRYLYLVVVDGRQTASRGMTYKETADLLINLGVYWGLNLDGGGSSTMVIQGRGLINRPAGGTYQRPVASSLGFFAYANQAACPVGREICDGKDNDCDALVDEDEICEGELTAKLHASRFDRTHSDIDGDGKMDYCARAVAGLYCHFSSKQNLETAELVLPLTDANNWLHDMYYTTIRLADVNGDGKADVCARGSGGLGCWLSEGTKFGKTVSFTDFTDAGGWTNPIYYSTIRFGDINGDGKDDVCARWSAGYGCVLSTGSGFGKPMMIGDMGDKEGWIYPRYYGTIQLADINGDGKMDVCGRGGGGIICFPSTGTGFGPKINGPAWSDANGWHAIRYWSTIQFGDINGDGKDDICGRDNGGVTCHLSTGSGFGSAISATTWSDASSWNDPSNFLTIQMADINGDGKMDVCGKANVRVICVLSEGNKFGTSVQGPPLDDADKWSEESHYRSISYGDFNGDRKADLCARHHSGVVCYPSTGLAFGALAKGASWADAHGWANPQHAFTFRFSGLKPCVPQCGSKTCGPNGCGGSCGTCKTTENCEAGTCKPKCIPDCENKSCGSDGCGGLCGSCLKDEQCVMGNCSFECTPNCENKTCGPNGCGGLCGSCETNQICVAGNCTQECIPHCEGKRCGGDGCSGTCGTCAEGENCNAGECQSSCTPKTEVCDGVDNDCDGEVDEENVCKDCPLGLDDFGNCLQELPQTPKTVLYEEGCSCQTMKQQSSNAASFWTFFALVLGVFCFSSLRKRSNPKGEDNL